MRTPATAWRRWFGMLFLILAGGMLIWGLTVLRPHLSGRGFVIYWTLCFLFTGLSLLTAVVDLFAVRREARAERRALLQRTMMELSRKAKAKAEDQKTATDKMDEPMAENGRNGSTE